MNDFNLPNPGYPHGGILARASTDTIYIIGSTDKIYRMSSPLTIARFSRLRLVVNQPQASTSFVQICYYEEVDQHKLETCQSKCLSVQRGSNDISFDSAFSFRMTKINYIRLRQSGSTGSSLEAHTSVLSGLYFGWEPVPMVDNQDLCTDPNSLTIKSPQGSRCKCFDGFIASTTGRKYQGDLDKCVSCLSIPGCFDDRMHIIASQNEGTCTYVSSSSALGPLIASQSGEASVFSQKLELGDPPFSFLF
uniref:Uncharacterized protein n=1 Tax=Chaetoceros debilis TaxID=122233 RepID=A0A7S3Q7L0_9STRA